MGLKLSNGVGCMWNRVGRVQAGFLIAMGLTNGPIDALSIYGPSPDSLHFADGPGGHTGLVLDWVGPTQLTTLTVLSCYENVIYSSSLCALAYLCVCAWFLPGCHRVHEIHI